MEILLKEVLALRSEGSRKTIAELELEQNLSRTVAEQIAALNSAVIYMLDEEETMVVKHPASVVAGAIALGIAVGHLKSS